MQYDLVTPVDNNSKKNEDLLKYSDMASCPYYHPPNL